MTTRLPLYLLAGGRSQRFGSNKALALLDDRPLLLHSLEPCLPWAASITLVVHDPAPYASLGYRCLCDPEPFRGPLQGLETALSDLGEESLACLLDSQARRAAPSTALATETSEGWLLLMSCDLLGLQTAWLEALLTADRSSYQAVAFWRESDTPKARWQGFPALYHHSLLPTIRQHLLSGPASLWALLQNAATLALPCPAAWEDRAQINTPDALLAWKRR